MDIVPVSSMSITNKATQRAVPYFVHVDVYVNAATSIMWKSICNRRSGRRDHAWTHRVLLDSGSRLYARVIFAPPYMWHTVAVLMGQLLAPIKPLFMIWWQPNITFTLLVEDKK